MDGVGFESLQGEEICSLFQIVNTDSGAHPDSYSVGTGVFPGTAHLHLVPRLRMNGAIPLLPLYAFMAWTGTALPLPFPWFITVSTNTHKSDWQRTHAAVHLQKQNTPTGTDVVAITHASLLSWLSNTYFSVYQYNREYGQTQLFYYKNKKFCFYSATCFDPIMSSGL
jgi:hypothetical protein